MGLDIALYLTLGLTFTAMVDSISKRHLPQSHHFSNGEKFFIVLLWPANLAIFLIELIKAYRNLRK